MKKKVLEQAVEQAEAFGRWLKIQRDRRGLSQEALADRIGRSKQHISGWERAAPHPTTGKPPKITPEAAKALAEALDVPPETVFREAGFLPKTSNGDDDRRVRLLAYFDGLSDTERDHALALIDSMYKHRTKAAHS